MCFVVSFQPAMAKLLLLVVLASVIGITFSLDLTGEKSAAFGVNRLTYANDEFKDGPATAVTVPMWSANAEYSMCPPGNPTVQKWFYKPKGSSVRMIASQEAPNSNLLLMPGIKLRSNCLIVKNLTSEWLGTFYFAPYYKTNRKWVFLNASSTAGEEPMLLFEATTAPSAPLRLCPPLSFYKQGAAGSLRWHFTGFGARGHFQIAYRYQDDYWWFGYKYSVYTQEAKSSKLNVAMTASGCVDVAPPVGNFVYVTSSSDPKGDYNIRRKVWFFKDPKSTSTLTPTRLGVMSSLTNPDYFYKYDTPGYKYHYTYFDMETSIRITERKTIDLNNQDLTLCANQYFPREASWQFYPAYMKSRKQADGKMVIHRNSVSMKHILTSPGFTFGDDYRCMTIKNAGADVAGDWFYVPGLGSSGSVWDKETSQFTLKTPRGEKEYTPRSLYRRSYVQYGQKNVWVCPSRHGQITQTDIYLYLEDPITQQSVLLMKRNEWHSPIDFADFGQRHYFNRDIIYSPDSTACFVIQEINNITMGKYKFVFHHTPLKKTWTEIVDVLQKVSRRPQRSLPSPSTTPAPTEVKVRRARSVCDGCKEFNYRYNKKYVRRDESVNLQGYLDADLIAKNCTITWKDPRGVTLVSVDYKGSKTMYREDLFDGRYEIFRAMGGIFMIRNVLPSDEGTWIGNITCANWHDNFAILTQLYLVDTIEPLKAEPFSMVESPMTNILGKTAINITQNGQRPACFDEPEPRRCEYLPETDQLVFYLFDIKDTGLWILNYTIQGEHGTTPYVRLLTASLKTTPGCFVPREKNAEGVFDPNWQYRDQNTLIWSKVIGHENPILKPICMVKGGYFVKRLDKNHTCFFRGMLDVHDNCGLYWAYAYRKSDHNMPVSISAYYAKCSQEEEAPIMVCPPVGSMVNPGEFVESPYPMQQIINRTVITTFRGNNDSTTRQICFAREGWAMWNKTFCLYDGAYKSKAKYCGTHYTFAFNSKRYTESQLLRHIILCPKNSRTRRSPRVAPLTNNWGEEQEMIVPVVHDQEGSVTNFVDVADAPETWYTIMIDINATSAELRDAGDFIVIPIVNSTTTTGIILASLLILLLFFVLWLYCKWKKSRKQHKQLEYDRAPLYCEKANL